MAQPGCRALLFLVLGLAAVLAVLATPAPAADLDAGGTNYLYVEIDAQDLVLSGSSLPVEVHVTDRFGHPVERATVYISVSDGSTSDRELFTDADGRVAFLYTATSRDLVENTLRVRVFKEGFVFDAGSEADLGIAVVPLSEPRVRRPSRALPPPWKRRWPR